MATGWISSKKTGCLGKKGREVVRNDNAFRPCDRFHALSKCGRNETLDICNNVSTHWSLGREWVTRRSEARRPIRASER